jgi:DNA-damage-inducible protein J
VRELPANWDSVYRQQPNLPGKCCCTPRAVLREKRIPFEITGNDDPFYSAKNQAILAKSIEDLEAGRGRIEKTWEELEAMEGE